MQWLSLTTLVFTSARAIKGMITDVVELDKAITDIRYVTGSNRDETDRLISSYEKLAQRLGATTLEVTASANEWLNKIGRLYRNI